MCKNLFAVGIKPEKQKEMHALMLAAAPIMTDRDNDGFGYAAITENGLYGERWLHPSDAFTYRQPWTEKDAEIQKMFHGTLEGDAKYSMFREKPEAPKAPTMALIMHARYATCEKGIKNTHPFYRDGVALIHNGVISNVAELKQITSTCDSECILNSYVDHNVANNPDKIDLVGKDLRGGYACGVLTKDKDGTPILDIFRSTPYLYSCYIKELDALVFCTTMYIVQQICEKLKWTHGSFFKVKDDVMLRVNAKTGELISQHNFRSFFGSYSSGGYTGGHGGQYNTGTSGAANNSKSEASAKSQEACELERAGVSGIRVEKKSKLISSVSPKQRELNRIKTHGMNESYLSYWDIVSRH